MDTKVMTSLLLCMFVIILSACSPWKNVTPDRLHGDMSPGEAWAVLSRLKVETNLEYRCQTDTRWVVVDDFPYFPRILRHGGGFFSWEQADREVPVYTHYPVSLKEILEMEGKHDMQLFYHERDDLYRVDIAFTPPCALREYQKVTLYTTPSRKDAELVMKALKAFW